MVKLSYSCLREEPQRVDVSLMVVIFTCDGLILGGKERIEEFPSTPVQAKGPHGNAVDRCISKT